MMDSSHQDQAEKSSPETGSDSSMSPCSSDNSDVFGDPLVHPRVGDEYQAEIPTIVNQSEVAESDDIVDSSLLFWCGLPVPVMSFRNQATLTETVEPNVKVEALDQICVSNEYCLVPGIPTEPWSDFEADCFLLGLYLLGKNLLQVARFVESKGMGQILAYYYGQFYASAGYSRWSACRKMKSKKCVIGHRFFTGYRQQELFSRLFPRLSEESKTKLSEASKAFAEGSSSLDEYVFTLKAVVGINALVDAVGIGKGKVDLTTVITDGLKSNQVSSHRSEVPSLKAYSGLTCAEITNYLTGDFRLSKARSNDLFWEAVWPRLLARGWHSEQPLCNGYKGSNHLVFLMPGIKKFSRRKLSKGDHYFDSISDVLAKIASEPELLKLDDDETNCSISKVKSDDDRDSSDNERRCYLKPRVSSGFSDLTKFTIVDTSLANQDNPYKVVELRSLPEDADRCSSVHLNGRKNSTLSTHSRELTIDKFGSLGNFNGDHNPMNHKPKTIKHQFSRRPKHGLSLSSCESTSVTKRRRLSSSADADVTYVLSLPAKTRNATLRIVGPKLGQTDIKQVSENVLVADNTSEKSVQESLNLNHVGPKLGQTDVKQVSENVLVADNTSEKSVQESLNLNHVGLDISRENEKMSAAQQVIEWNLPQKPGDEKLTEVEKTKHCDVYEQVRSDDEILKICDAKKLKHSVQEKQKISEATVCHDQMESRATSASQEPLKAVLDSDQQLDRHVLDQCQKISEVKTESQVNSASQEPSNPVVDSDQQSEGHVVVPKQEICEDTVGPSDNVEPDNKAANPDQQLRRQSKRSRPLTTKALEALELGFLSPPRQYRKRSSPSVADDQKPKRSRQPRNKSHMFPHDAVFDVKDDNNVDL